MQCPGIQSPIDDQYRESTNQKQYLPSPKRHSEIFRTNERICIGLWRSATAGSVALEGDNEVCARRSLLQHIRHAGWKGDDAIFEERSRYR